MKAAVLARGLGTRMREPASSVSLDAAQQSAAATGAKAMMPISGIDAATQPPRPFLDYILSSLADAGCDDVALVVGDEQHDIRERYTRLHPPRRVRLSFVVQPEPRGTAHAVLCCEGWAGHAAFLVVNADNLYPVPALLALARLDTPGLPAFERDDLMASSDLPSDRVAAFALLECDAQGWLTRIIEKPGFERLATAGPHALISMNSWRFDVRIFAACRDVPMSERGEFELPQAVGLALERDVRFRVVPARGPVLDLSRRLDVAIVSRRLAGIIPKP
jgi:dTDP-glucose pyrophosphorylase